MKKLNLSIAALLIVNLAAAQTPDSLRPTPDTVYVKETTVVEKPVAPVEKPDDDPVFHSGEFGVRFMPTFSTFELKNSKGNVIESDVVMSYGFGAVLGVTGKHVGVQLEAIYNSSSQKYKDNNMDRRVDINYINIPLLLTLNTDKSKVVNFNVAVGPQLAINVGSKLETSGNNNTDTLHAVLAVKSNDFGFAYGAGLEFALNKPRSVRLNLGFRGVYGLIDISDNSQTKATDTYLIIDKTNRETYSGYLGLSFMF
jgi:opacity protein-like surface antigen